MNLPEDIATNFEIWRLMISKLHTQVGIGSECLICHGCGEIVQITYDLYDDQFLLVCPRCGKMTHVHHAQLVRMVEYLRAHHIFEIAIPILRKERT
jgi:Fe2+ or Zn2+ uptake regulation protein